MRADILVFEAEEAVERFSGVFIRADEVEGKILQHVREYVPTEGTLFQNVIKRM